MTSLGYSSVPGANQVLQPTGLANPSNSHFTDPYPQFSSNVVATAGCIGAGSSAAALNANPGYNMEKQTGGKHGDRGAHVRGGYKKRHSKAKKSRKGKKRGCGCRGTCHCRKKRGCRCRGTCHCRRRTQKRSMRGGMSSLSPAPFSGGANAPYHQFTGGEPLSFNYGIGSATPLPLNEIGTAPNHMMNIHNNCGSNHGLVKLIN
jgi:hypothetical protein